MKEGLCLRKGIVAIDNNIRADLIKAKLHSRAREMERWKGAKKPEKAKNSFICFCFGAVMGCLVFLFIDKTHKFDDLFPAGYTE